MCLCVPPSKIRIRGLTRTVFAELKGCSQEYFFNLLIFALCSSFPVYSASSFQRSSHAPRICTAGTYPIHLLWIRPCACAHHFNSCDIVHMRFWRQNVRCGRNPWDLQQSSDVLLS
eukprot:23523_6